MLVNSYILLSQYAIPLAAYVLWALMFFVILDVGVQLYTVVLQRYVSIRLYTSFVEVFQETC